MPMHRFQVSDPAAFLEIAELIFRSSRAGESVAIELPLKGCAGALTNWQTEQARLCRKMDLPPDIHVSVNRSGGDQIVVRTEREVIMNRTIIKNILESLVPIERIKQWIPNESATDEPMPVDGANTGAPLNILYSALRDCLVAHNLDVKSLDAGNDISNSIRGVSIWPQTEDAVQFIIKHSRYGSALETGIKRFIMNCSSNWPLLKAVPDMSLQLNSVKHPEKGSQTDFHIEFDWGNAAEPVVPFQLHSVTQPKPLTAPIGKKLLPHPLTVTVDSGTSPVAHQITHVPCRINCLDGDWSEVSLTGCKYVSKNHIVLDLLNGQLVLLDQGSSHGTFTADGRDLRRLPGMQYAIQLNSSTEIFLCFGSTEQQIRNNRQSGDRKKFPRLVIEYGSTTPEIGGFDGTPELEALVNY